MSNKRVFWGIASLIAVVTIILIWAAMQKPAAPTSANKKQIAATIFPIADMASNIAGDQIHVITILPPGASPHTFEPTPELIRELQNVRIVFAVGHGLDDWIGRLITELPETRIVYLDQGIRLRAFEAHEDEDHAQGDGKDPHYWLSGKNGITMTQTISDTLRNVWPEYTDEFNRRQNAYQTELAQMDQTVADQLSSLPRKQIVTHHDSWGYFAEAYGLSVAGSFEAEPGKPPTPAELAGLQKLVKDNQIPAVFVEPQLPEEIIKPFADDLRIAIRILDPIGGVAGRMSYIELMKFNAQTIADAL